MTEIIIDLNSSYRDEYNIIYEDGLKITCINLNPLYESINIKLKDVNDNNITTRKLKVENNRIAIELNEDSLRQFNNTIKFELIDSSTNDIVGKFIINYKSKLTPRTMFRRARTMFAPLKQSDANVPFEYLTIDEVTRQITIPESELLMGVEDDNRGERKYFKCPRYVGNELDLSTLNLRVNWRNANGDLGSDLISDIKIINENEIEFYWILSRGVTAYVGEIEFIVCAVKADFSGVVENKWNTTKAKGKVIIGLPLSSPIIEQPEKDTIAQLLAIMKQNSEDNVQRVTNEGNTQVERVRAEGNTQHERILNEGNTQHTRVLNEGNTQDDRILTRGNEQVNRLEEFGTFYWEV